MQSQTAIISGGRGDIGRAIEKELSSRGTHVEVGDIFPPDTEQANYCQVDITDPEAVRTWVHDVHPNIVIANAGIVIREPLQTLSAEDWNRQLAVNLNGAFYLANEAARLLVQEKREGRIVFLGSWVADRVNSNIPAYCVSKAAVRMLMKSMAAAYAKNGILVNEIAAGYVDAGLTGQHLQETPGRRQELEARIPVGSLISAEEVAKQVAVLCDPENRQLTGSTLLLDGGVSLT